MEDRPFTGVFIPAKLYLDNNLNWVEKILIVEIQSLCNEKEPCKATNEHFAKHLNLSKKRVSEIINKLVKNGYLLSKNIYKKDSKQIEKRWLLVNNVTYTYFQGEGIEEKTDTPIPKNTEENKVNKNNNTPYNPPKKKIKKINEILFTKFWDTYPKKISKGNAEKWFEKNNPSEELVNKMISKLELLKTTKQWQDENGKYIPYPATWLNAKGWEDEIEINSKSKIEKRFFN